MAAIDSLEWQCRPRASAGSQPRAVESFRRGLLILYFIFDDPYTVHDVASGCVYVDLRRMARCCRGCRTRGTAG
jgi:hypothetical protein